MWEPTDRRRPVVASAHQGSNPAMQHALVNAPVCPLRTVIMNTVLRLLPLLLLGCDEAKDPAPEASSGLVDGDGDGFSTDVDCDDSNAAVSPNADELCDGLDNNCDGAVDEDTALDAATWFIDSDADGFGDPATSLRACAAPAGHVADSTDCDDASAAIHPDADEICDERDNNCDGAVDEDTAVDAATWFGDINGDGLSDLLVGSTGTIVSNTVHVLMAP